MTSRSSAAAMTDKPSSGRSSASFLEAAGWRLSLATPGQGSSEQMNSSALIVRIRTAKILMQIPTLGEVTWGLRLKPWQPCKVQSAAPEDHSQCWNWRRNSDLSSLPVEVWGKLGTNMNASGNCHLANLQARNERSSAAVTWQSALRTTAASGLSSHLGCGAAITAASCTAG